MKVSICTVVCLLIDIRYFVIGHIARNDAEIIRLAGLLRGTESAAQAVSVSELLRQTVIIC